MAQSPTPEWRVEVTSPAADATVGGAVSVLGTVSMDGLLSYALAFGPGMEPQQWIQIGESRDEEISEGRLAFWDTTEIPDGIYTLRLRAIHRGEADVCVDGFSRSIHVSNAPRTSTPRPTPRPTATPTLMSTQPIRTPVATLALSDGVSPYLDVAITAQHDPLCSDWQQRYSIWLSNVGMTPLTQVVVTNFLPVSSDPVLAQSTDGATWDETRTVRWDVGTMAPGEAIKLELQVKVPSWLSTGTWLENEVRVSSDQLPYLSKTSRSLLSVCPWLAKTVEAQFVELPTMGALPTTTPIGAPQGKPTVLTTPTRLTFTIPEGTVKRGLDIFTIVVAAGLGLLAIVTGVLLYRRVFGRR